MKKLVIDPGHGGNDPGAINGSYKEKDFNLAISLKVRDYLLANYDVNVLMTRSTDKTMDLSERTQFANSNKADYFCSIHINAGGGTGWESYIYNGTVSQFTINAQNKIHSAVINAISSKYSVRDRGKKRANFHVLRESNMPAILLENLFIDTTADLNLLRSNTFINDLAKGIATGLAQALSLPSKSTALYKVIAGSFTQQQNALDRKSFLDRNGIESSIHQVLISGKTYYRVQAGAFRDRTNAEARLNEVKKLGITDAYILVE